LNKVAEINLEYGNPTVEMAVQKMKNGLTTCRGQGCKAVIVIHGYGSSGVGGGIKSGIRKVLAGGGMQGIVRAFCGGEDWVNRKRDILSVCPAIDSCRQNISGNEGLTVVVLR